MEHKAESTWANKRKEEQELGSKAFMIKSPHLPNRMLCRGCEKSWAILSLYPFGIISSAEDSHQYQDEKGRRAAPVLGRT